MTDGAWFIGSHLVDRLLLADETEVVVDNFGLFYPRPAQGANLADAPRSPRCRLLELDIRDAPWVSALMERVRSDAIVHLPARAGVRPNTEAPGLCADVNVTGTVRWLDAAFRIEPRPRFVDASRSSVDGDRPDAPFRKIDPVDLPVSPYAATKKASKLLAYRFHHLHGVPVTGLPCFTAYGPRDRFALVIATFTRLCDRGEQVPMFGDGATRRDYTFVADIVDRIVTDIDRCRAHHLYNLGELRPHRAAAAHRRDHRRPGHGADHPWATRAAGGRPADLRRHRPVRDRAGQRAEEARGRRGPARYAAMGLTGWILDRHCIQGA